MKHNGLVAPASVNWETGFANWQASCSCGWRHDRTNTRQTNANRALSRHIRSVAAARPAPALRP